MNKGTYILLMIGLFFGLIAIFLGDDTWNIGSYQEGISFKPNDTSSESNITAGNESVINTTSAADTNRSSLLKVVVRVNNPAGEGIQPSSFYVSIYDKDGRHASAAAHPDVFDGSANGTVSTIIPGTYTLHVKDMINGVPYALEFSGNCIGKGLDVANVVIKPGDKVTCIVTASPASF
jgi:hypothetical protein